MTMSFISLRLLSFLSLTVIIAAQRYLEYRLCVNYTGFYTANSTYKTNLNALLSNLTSNANIDYGFYNISLGQDPDKISAIGLCRGDIKPDACRGCLYNASILLPQNCTTNKEAWGGYDECILRYSNRQILHFEDYINSVYTWNMMNITVPWDKYKPVLRQLLQRLTTTAASGDSLRKFAAEKAEAPDFQTIYAVTQCTPDLSEQDCEDCLTRAISEISYCCTNRIGARVVKPSCNLRYEKDRFYDPAVEIAVTPASPPNVFSPPPPTNIISPQENSKTSRSVIIAVVPVAAFVVLLIFIFCRLRKKRNAMGSEVKAEADEDIKVTESLQFDLDTIKAATNDFSDENKLGQGGFGAVYKGRLYNGKEVAVKRLSMNSKQGDEEFKNEVLLVAKLQHRNLVRLLGFCLEGKERLLVYEFVQNKSLDFFIFNPVQSTELNWAMRYKIIGGIVRGMVYLHEDSRLRIIHRDLKASNILLDENMNPKIADFGMARMFDIDQTQESTSKVVGTYGYIAPEYIMRGHFSIKSDVFSFGVLVLEILSGQKNSRIGCGEDAEGLISYVWKNWREGTATNVIDPALTSGSRNEMMRCIHIGLLCVQENLADRPNMASVMLMLSSNSQSLPIPSRPAFFMGSGSLTASIERASNSAEASVDEAQITELHSR